MYTCPFELPLDDLDFVADSVGINWESLRNKKLFITGGTGFIGKWLLGTFLYSSWKYRLNASVVVLSRNPELFLDRYPSLRNFGAIVWVKGDVVDFPIDSIKDCEFAIHAATDVEKSTSPLYTISTCIDGSRRVIDALASSGIDCKLLLISSGAVYGHIPADCAPVKEGWHGAPNILSASSVYGEAKRISELLAIIASDTYHNFQCSIARCFAFVGPYLPLDKHFAIGNFIAASLRNQDILINGDGSPLRTYMYTSDLARWFWIMLFNGKNKSCFNVGGAEPISIYQLADKVNKIVGGTGSVLVAKEADPKNKYSVYVPSLLSAKNELNLFEAISLDNSIKKTASWLTKHWG